MARMQSARPSTSKMRDCSASTRSVLDAQRLIARGRRLGDHAGAIDLAQRLPHGYRVVPAVGEIEGLIDQRKIRHDVVDDGVLEHGPVLPRRIVGMTAPDRAAGARFECHQHRAAPSLDQCRAQRLPRGACAIGAWCAPAGSFCRMPSIRRTDSSASSKRTATRAATSPSWRARLDGLKLAVRLAGQIAAKIQRLAARPAGESGQAQSCGERRSDHAGAHETVAQSGVLVVDRTQRRRLHGDHLSRLGQQLRGRRSTDPRACPPAR